MRIPSFNINMPSVPEACTWTSGKIQYINLTVIKNACLQKSCRLGWKGPVPIIGIITVIIGMRLLFLYFFTHGAIPPTIKPTDESNGLTKNDKLDTQHSEEPITTEHRPKKRTTVLCSLEKSILDAKSLLEKALKYSTQATEQANQAQMHYTQAFENEKSTSENRELKFALWVKTRQKTNNDFLNPERMEEHSEFKRAVKEHNTAIEQLHTAGAALSVALKNEKSKSKMVEKRIKKLNFLIRIQSHLQFLKARYQADKQKVLSVSHTGNSKGHQQHLMRLRQQRQKLSSLGSHKGSINNSRTFSTSFY